MRAEPALFFGTFALALNNMPAIAQLAEHLTVAPCSNQMVPGSIPGGRIFLAQHAFRRRYVSASFFFFSSLSPLSSFFIFVFVEDLLFSSCAPVWWCGVVLCGRGEEQETSKHIEIHQGMAHAVHPARIELATFSVLG